MNGNLLNKFQFMPFYYIEKWFGIVLSMQMSVRQKHVPPKEDMNYEIKIYCVL